MPDMHADYRTQHHGRAAFTLVELLVVIVVLSIVAAIVATGQGAAGDSRLMAAGRILIADLEHARAQSMCSTADRCVVIFDPAGDRYRLSRKSDLSQPLLDLSTGLPYERVFGFGDASIIEGISVESSNIGGDNQIEFTGLGRIDQASDATVTLRSSAGALTVIIDAGTGDPRIQP